MIAYVESSVLVRVVLGQPDRLAAWSTIERAADPFPTPLGTLDAIHLATAILWRDARAESPVLATHDAQLAMAARATGLPTVGA